MEENTVTKRDKFLRYFSYWLYVVLSIGIPIALLTWQFDLFKKPGVLQITGYGIIAIIIVLFICKGHLKRAVDDMEKGIIRTTIQNIMRIFPLLIFWFVLTFLDDQIVKVRFILFWSTIGYFAAMFVDIWHTSLVKKCQKEKTE